MCISSKHQVTLPTDALRSAGLAAGDLVEVVAVGAGEISLRRARNPYREFAGALTGLYPPGDLDRLREDWR